MALPMGTRRRFNAALPAAAATEQAEKSRHDPGSPESAEHAHEAVAQLVLELRRSMEVCLRDQEDSLQSFMQRLVAPGLSVAPLTKGKGMPCEVAAQHVETDEWTWNDTGVKDSNQRPIATTSTDEFMRRQDSLVEHLNSKVSFPKYSSKLRRSFVNGEARSEAAESLAESRMSSSRWFMRVFWSLYYHFDGLEEPPRRSRLASIILSWHFEFVTMVMILLNGAFVVTMAELDARSATQDPAGLEEEPWWGIAAESTFTAYFILELVLKLLVHKTYFFCNTDWRWNIFDFFIISATALDIFMTVVSASIAAADTNFLRVIRIFKLAKSLRLLRALHFVEHFRKLLECMASSMSHIVWSSVWLLFITVIFATVLSQVVTDFWIQNVTNEGSESDDVESLNAYFGSVARATFSLFKATSGGKDWNDFYVHLEQTGSLAPFIFVMYVLFSLIAAWNIVTSLFIEKALMIAQPDLDRQLMEKWQQEVSDGEELFNLVKSMDVDGDGVLTLTEFISKLRIPRVHAFLELRNINIKDAETFFHILQAAANTPEIPVHTVVNALMKMRGVATNMDLSTLQFQIQVQNAAHSKAFRTIQDEVASMHKLLQLLWKESGSSASL